MADHHIFVIDAIEGIGHVPLPVPHSERGEGEGRRDHQQEVRGIKMRKCAKRPCASCPYRLDAPSGLWAVHEYDKLPAYDGEIVEQLAKGAKGTFLCHQRDGHLCAGWIAAHRPENLLALRLDREVDSSVYRYTTDVPVFASGAEAREHGLRDLEHPGAKARRLMDKLSDKGKAN
jgi:hypothetical protein